MPSVGIGIITYNRKDLVAGTIDRVRKLTGQPDALLVVADDGSTDGTLAMLRQMRVPVVTGSNMGAAWNKNRALFMLSHLLGCETVILLEDDTQPDEAGWEAGWMEAVRRWGHVNYAGEWLREHFLSGSGSVNDPVLSKNVTAQCSAVSGAALTYGGYFDTRFKGYGHQHVEHTVRLIRVGYGGTLEQHEGRERVVFKMISGGVVVQPCKSHYQAEQVEYNLKVAQKIMGQQDYRAPWGNDVELRQFRSEMDSARSSGLDWFRIHRDRSGIGTRAPGRGLLYRFFSGRRDRKI
jgi:glycosyltransferase involved in cell wall biosynthesis